MVVVALATTACGDRSDKGQQQAGGGVITVDGSSTVFPITEAVAEEFQKANAGTRVTVGISGTGGGFQKFCRAELDIADASRPIKPTEIDACAKAGVTFIEVPIAYDGIAIVVHPKNTWATSITVAELKKLWEPAARGQIMRWSQIRAGWPDREIHLFGPGVDSGTFDYFTEVITGKSKASRSDYTSSEDDNVLVQGVGGDEGALGYFGLAYYEENRAKLKLVPVDPDGPDGGAPALEPSVGTIRSNAYRPLSRPVFIYPSVKALARPEVKAFVEYYLTKGSALAQEVGYVPLNDKEYELARQRVSSVKTGTMFIDGSGHDKTLEALMSSGR